MSTVPPAFAGRTLLVMGGKPIGSSEIVAYAKARGARVIVTDWLAPADSPAKQLADESWPLSTADVEAIVARARAACVDAVFTGIHEFNLRQTEQVCRRLGVPFYATATQLAQTSDKAFYKALLARHGLEVIADYQPGDAMAFPVLIKPTRGSGAYGIRLCADAAAFARHYPEAVREAGADGLLIERYVHGEELTAFYLVVDGRIHLSAVADRLTTPVADGTIRLPYLYRWPSKALAQYRDEIDAKMVAALASLGLRNGMVFIQFMRADGRLLPYDMGFRLTGSQEHHVLGPTCGINALELLVDYAFTGRMGEGDPAARVDPTLHGRYAANMTLLARPGRIGRFVGLEAVTALPQVTALVPHVAEGDTLPDSAVGTLNQVALRVFLVADDEATLQAAITRVDASVQILDPDGVDMRIPSSYGQH